MILDEIVAKKEIRLKAIDKVKFKKLPFFYEKQSINKKNKIIYCN